MTKKFTFLLLFTVCTALVNAQSAVEVFATFNGNSDSDWANSANWTTDTLTWDNPKAPYWVLDESNSVYAIISATIPNGKSCVLNDTDSTYDFSSGYWYKRLTTLTIEQNATLDFSYRTDSASGYLKECYLGSYLTLNGTLNINKGSMNVRYNKGASVNITTGTLVINDGGIFYGNAYAYLGETYAAATETTEEVNSFGRIIVNGGSLTLGSVGIRIKNHYAGNTEPALQINGGYYYGAINDLLNTENKGYGVTKAGQIEINSTGELRLTGYSLNDLYQCFYDGIFSSSNGTKVTPDSYDDATTKELALAHGLVISTKTDYLSITANYVETKTGVDTPEKDIDLNVYPNPSKDAYFI